MGFEIFYGQHASFFGWHCLLCGDILDPVILLHRLSRDANLPIPENEGEILSLIRKYGRVIPRDVSKCSKYPEGWFDVAQEH